MITLIRGKQHTLMCKFEFWITLNLVDFNGIISVILFSPLNIHFHEIVQSKKMLNLDFQKYHTFKKWYYCTKIQVVCRRLLIKFLHAYIAWSMGRVSEWSLGIYYIESGELWNCDTLLSHASYDDLWITHSTLIV